MTKEEIITTLTNYAELREKASQILKKKYTNFVSVDNIEVDDENNNRLVVGYLCIWSDGTHDYDVEYMLINDFIDTGVVNKNIITDFKNKIKDYSKEYSFSQEEVLNILERYEIKYKENK